MKQHERTHKNQNGKNSSIASSPVIASARGSRRASAGAGADTMDVDSDGSGLGIDLSRTGKSASRPKMPRSELSEIIEGLDRQNRMHKDEDADVDGEGESPGLDALATAASEMA